MCIRDRPLDECIKGFVGNAVVFPQADGGALVTSLPPAKDALVEKVVVAMVSADENVGKAFVRELAVSLEEFQEAYEWLRGHNELYAKTAWDEAAAAEWREAEKQAGPEGAILPPALARCVVKCASEVPEEERRTRQ